MYFLDANYDVAAKKSDVTTFAGAFEGVMRQHYPSMVGHIAIRLVSCPSICSEGLGILSRYAFFLSAATITSKAKFWSLQSQSL
jgi:membrane-associated phosphatidylinositol transfer protein